MTLTEIRKEKGIKTIDLAASLGISQGYYSNLERGKRPFNKLLLKKTAKALGIRVTTLQEAVKLQPAEKYKLRSWMSNIRIHGLPLIRAFQYHLETIGADIHSLDDIKLKSEMKKFIESNIGYAILAELAENKSLISHIRETIYNYSMSPKNILTINRNKY